jgi:membrane protein required for colicin V production
MQVLDWIILAALILSMLLGAWRGLVYEVLSVLGWAAAFILAQWFAPDMAQLLPMRGAGEAVRYAAGFVLVFVLSVFVAALLARLAKTLFSMVGLQPVDRILGAVFGLVRGAVLVLAAAVVITMTPLQTSDWWRGSVGAGIASAAVKGLKPLLPQEFGKYLP